MKFDKKGNPWDLFPFHYPEHNYKRWTTRPTSGLDSTEPRRFLGGSSRARELNPGRPPGEPAGSVPPQWPRPSACTSPSRTDRWSTCSWCPRSGRRSRTWAPQDKEGEEGDVNINRSVVTRFLRQGERQLVDNQREVDGGRGWHFKQKRGGSGREKGGRDRGERFFSNWCPTKGASQQCHSGAILLALAVLSLRSGPTGFGMEPFTQV